MDVSHIIDSLNDAQREAVTAQNDHLLVLAGAGSGKTRVLVHRMAWLMSVDRVPPTSILAVTFTNKAAKEMRYRVEQMMQIPTRGLWIGTFHGIAHRLLRSHWKDAGLPENFQVLDSDDQLRLIKRVMRENRIDESQWPPKQAQWFINSQKDEGLRADHIQENPGDHFTNTMLKIYRQYEKLCQQGGLVDFGELLLRSHELWLHRPELLSHYQQRFQHILVDEFQDTNTIQYAWLQVLASNRVPLTVVGDDDQSIYAWRGARPENLAQLKDDFPSLKIVKLEQNYRSTSRILRCANTVIANNPHVFEKALWSDHTIGEEIRIIRCRNEDAETERVATEILDQKLKNGLDFRDFAVLYRGNHQARLLEMKLQAYQIPYRISGGQSFFSKNEIKDAMSYLRLMINPDDDAAFLRVVNVPRREIGPRTLEQLSHYARSRNVSLFKALGDMGAETHVTEKGLDRLRRFAHWVDKTCERLFSEDPIPVIKQLFTDIEYEEWLHQHSGSPKQAERRMENIWYLVESIQRMLDDGKGTADEIGIEDAIAKLVLRDMMEQREEEDDSDKVQLLTLHASKGLEFPHVFIMGLEEEILPHRSSIEEGNIEEERRLMYVGITRARETLALTYAASRKQYGEKLETIPSRFLDELPEEDVKWEGLGDQDKEANQKKGKATLSALIGDLGL